MWPATKGKWRNLPLGAIAHKDAVVSPVVRVLGPAVFHGGYFHGGNFYGGDFRGGYFYEAPFQLFCFLPWNANVSAPNELTIGCCHYSLDYWRKHLREIAAKHQVTEETSARVARVIELAAASVMPRELAKETEQRKDGG